MFCKTTLRWMPLYLSDHKSTLVQVMAWCRQATSHYLSPCWPLSLMPYSITKPQWVKLVHNFAASVIHSSLHEIFWIFLISTFFIFIDNMWIFLFFAFLFIIYYCEYLQQTYHQKCFVDKIFMNYIICFCTHMYSFSAVYISGCWSS